MSEVSMPTFNISGISEGEADAVAAAINVVWKLDDYHVFDGKFTGNGVMDGRRIPLEDLRSWVQSAIMAVIHSQVSVEIFEFEDEEEEEEDDERYSSTSVCDCSLCNGSRW